MDKFVGEEPMIETRRCIILSGLPGSGKSYMAKRLKSLWGDQAIICSVDESIDYSRPRRPQLPEATRDCFIKANFCLQDRDHSIVIIDSTNLHAYEIAPYYLMAEAYGWEVVVQRLSTPAEVAYKRQVHRVPWKAFAKLIDAYHTNDDAPWWNVEEI